MIGTEMYKTCGARQCRVVGLLIKLSDLFADVFVADAIVVVIA